MGKSNVALAKGWFVEHSPKQTVMNMIRAGDVHFLKTVTPEEFENLLVNEMLFLAPYDEEQQTAVKQYIHVNRDELYGFLQDLPG
jgi:hypothetical protein